MSRAESRFFRVRALRFISLFVLFVPIGCWQQKPAPQHATVALVNDEGITLQELLSWVSDSQGTDLKGLEASLQEKQELRKKLLDQLIERKILLQEARRLKIEPAEEAFQERLREIKEGKDETTFDRFLSERNVTRETWERSVREDFLIEQMLNQMAGDPVQISEQELARYYDSHMKEWEVGEQLRLRKITVGTSEEAQSLRARILSGADFAQAAQEHAGSFDAEKGGDLGYRTSLELPVEFDPLFQAAVGSVSEVIQTPFGYHIVKVEDHRPARTLPFEEVKERIRKIVIEQKRERAFSKWMEKMRLKTEVKINEELLHKLS